MLALAGVNGHWSPPLRRAALEASRTRPVASSPGPLRESWGVGAYDWVPYFADALSRQHMDYAFPLFGQQLGRVEGAMYPFYWTEFQLNVKRNLSWILYHDNPYAQGLCNGIVNYTVGTGPTVAVKPRRKLDDLPSSAKHPDAPLAAKAQEVWDWWAKKHNAYARWRELETRAFVSGDGLIRLFKQPHGLPVPRWVWSEHVRRPPDGGIEFEFGIRCKRVEWADDEGQVQHGYDTEDEEEYCVWPFDADAVPEIVPADEILHMRSDWTWTGIKRGLPRLSQGIHNALDLALKLARNTGEGAAVRAAIAFIRTHEGATQRQISEFVEAHESFQSPRFTSPASLTMESIRKVEPGTVYDVGKNTSFAPPPASGESSAAEGNVSMLLRAAGAPYHAPEWLYGGTAGDRSFAGAITEQDPFALGTLARQGEHARRLEGLVWAVLKAAEACEMLPEGACKALDVEAKFPSPVTRDKLKEAQTNQVEIELGYSSPQHCAQQAGVDYARIQADRKEAGLPPVGSGPAPPQPPGGPDGGPGDAPNGAPPKPPPPGGRETPEKPPWLEEAIAVAVDRAVASVLEGEDAAGHEHDARGRFGSGGGSPESSEHVKGLLARASEVPLAVASKVHALVSAQHERLSARYGPAGATAVLGAMLALLPVPVPGSSLVPIAVAEAVVRLRRQFASEKAA